MPHFIIEKNCIKENTITIKDKELLSHLVQALRTKKGEIVKFLCEETVYYTEIIKNEKNELKAEIKRKEKSKRKLDINLCAAICVLKPDSMHLAIENAVQLGAKEIYTVYSENSAVKKDSILQKADKWQKIALESVKQCERADIPKVYNVMTFKEILEKFEKNNIIVFAEKYDEYTIQNAVKNINKKEKILAIFGPEGGFSDREFEYFKSENLKLVTLGKLILKAQNAISAGLFGIEQWMML